MSKDFIQITGARENNLKNIDVRIPKRKLTIFTGVSGSGKSSIVFDTLAEEAGRQLNETFSNVIRLFLPRHRQPEADAIEHIATAIVVDQKRIGGNARSTLGTITDINAILRLLFSRFGQPHLGYGNAFSFNDPSGMCPECEGIGKIVAVDLNKSLDMDKSLQEGAILLPGFQVGAYYWKFYAESGLFDPHKKMRDYSDGEYHQLVYGAPQKVQLQGEDVQRTYEGLAERFIRLNMKTEKERSAVNQQKFIDFTVMKTCPRCEGKRYNERALSSKILGYSIYDLTSMQPAELIATLQKITEPRVQPLIRTLTERLTNLIDIGLDYMALTRETSTLSGGESQRVKMVKQLSSSLTDVMYIFDEPSIGLHPRDVHRLNDLLLKLRDKGNTVIVVEHDPDVIKIADHIIDVGPGAGTDGGRIVYEGDYNGLLHANTVTAQHLRKALPLKTVVRRSKTFLEAPPSRLHNLKAIAPRIPKGVFTVVTGVAGSGKSTLINHVFAAHYPEAITVDQRGLKINSRANAATFLGIMDDIRQCFARENQVDPGLFSYNSKGACPHCNGTGSVELNLSFMDKMQVPCEECQGTRFRPDVLQYTFMNKTIVEMLAMTIAEVVETLPPPIVKKLRVMIDVGLAYLTLGQPLSTLSGGECQRLKLARELNKSGNIYILDEPTTGLHQSDITTILKVTDALVDSGNTVIAIEHNLDIIRNADWMIDLGPDGGHRGGELLYAGPPQGITSCKRSVTARYL